MRQRLTAAQMQAMTKEQIIKHTLAVQEQLDQAARRAKQFGQALEQMGYFTNPQPDQAQHNQEVPHA